MTYIKTIFQRFFIALTFYTRVPFPMKWLDYTDEKLNQGTRHLPFIGWIVGGVSSVVLFGLSYGASYFSSSVPISVFVILSMITSILLTGAFHEDGFADVCDGFGGGWTKEKILEIMKDSRVGSYGVIGLVLILLLKYSCLVYICDPSENCVLFGVFALMIGHTYSRFLVIRYIHSHQYVRMDDSSKSRPVGSKNISFWGRWCVAPFWGLLPIVLLSFLSYWILLVLIPPLIAKWVLAFYFRRKIGGYTGDCLGAMQQVTEVVVYVSLVIFWTIL